MNAEHPNCTHTLRAAGKSYPRTCAECGIGPCKVQHAPLAQPEIIKAPATASPADIDSPEFDKLLEKHAREFTAHSFRYVNDLIGANKSLYDYVNAWGGDQYEAGRQSEAARVEHLTHERDLARKAATEAVERAERAEAAREAQTDTLAGALCQRDQQRLRADQAEADVQALYDRQREDGNKIAALTERAERAEAALEEWTHTNKVDELGREVDRLRAAMASRPSVDLSGLRCFDEAGFETDYEAFAQFYRIDDVQALLSGKVEAPTGCSKDPNCCPNNEGYGCDCSVPTVKESLPVAPTASADGLPKLPQPDTHCYDEDEKRDVWSYSAGLLIDYAAQVRADVLEEAARLFDNWTGRSQFASAIRALNKKGGA